MSKPQIFENGRSVLCNLSVAAILLSGLAIAPLHAQAPKPVAPPPVAPAPVAPAPVAPAPVAPPPVAPAPAAPPPAAPPPVAATTGFEAGPAPGGDVLVAQPTPPPPAPVVVVAAEPDRSAWGSQAEQGPRETMKLGISYSMGFATGDYKDFVSEPSFRGFDLTALWPIYKSFYIGPAFGYNLFYEKYDRQTYDLSETSAVTGQLYRYSDYWTTSLVSRYYFLQPSDIARPYAGLRLGFSALLNTTLVADLAAQSGPVGFLAAPEAGVQLRISEVIAGSLSYVYNFSTASSSGFDNLSYGALQFGLVISWQDDD